MKNNKPALKSKNTINIKGNDVLTYAGKLDYAHQVGIKSLEAKIVQTPSPDNDFTAISSATLVTEEGKVFTDIGDANPDNVPVACSKNYIRMASTRAKARVLSDAFNLPSMLDDYSDDAPFEPSQVVYDVTPAENNKFSKNGGGTKPISEGQLNYIDGLCAKKGDNPEALAQDKFGKPLSDLVGQEADELIKLLRG